MVELLEKICGFVFVGFLIFVGFYVSDDVIAQDMSYSISNSDAIIDLRDADNGDFMTVITSKSKFRIYPCGKIEKLEWKEIHPNEDDSWIATSGSITYTTESTPSDLGVKLKYLGE